MRLGWKKGVRIAAAWGALAAILACGGNGSGSSGGSTSTTGTVFIGPGFTPDPAIRTGQAGGTYDGTQRGPGCIGYTSIVSDHMLHLTGDFTNLRVIARSDADIALIIAMSDGTYRCNDDAEGLNPIVQGPFPRGIHRIYVGSLQRDVRPTYTLGVTEMGNVTAAGLQAPAQ